MINNEVSFKAGGTIGPALFVKPDTTADEQVLQATAGAVCLGISKPWMKGAPGLAGSDTTIAAITGDLITVAGMGNTAMLTYGGTVTRGDLLKSDGSGRGITGSSGDECGAYALQSGTVGNQYKVLVIFRKA